MLPSVMTTSVAALLQVILLIFPILLVLHQLFLSATLCYISSACRLCHFVRIGLLCTVTPIYLATFQVLVLFWFHSYLQLPLSSAKVRSFFTFSGYTTGDTLWRFFVIIFGLQLQLTPHRCSLLFLRQQPYYSLMVCNIAPLFSLVSAALRSQVSLFLFSTSLLLLVPLQQFLLKHQLLKSLIQYCYTTSDPYGLFLTFPAAAIFILSNTQYQCNTI